MNEPTVERIIDLVEDSGGRPTDDESKQVLAAWHEVRVPLFEDHYAEHGPDFEKKFKEVSPWFRDLLQDEPIILPRYIQRLQDRLARPEWATSRVTIFCSPPAPSD